MATNDKLTCHCPECGAAFEVVPPATIAAYLERSGWERYPTSKEPPGHYFHVHPRFGPRSYPKTMGKGYAARFLEFIREHAEDEERSMTEVFNDVRGAVA